MAVESEFVSEAFAAAEKVLQPPLSVRRKAALLYQVTVDNNLSLNIDPKHPVRGDSAFETDLCVFETRSPEVVIPRVVLEFKTSVTTHDILTYSAKARKHKQVYPYLRYGLVASAVPAVPGRFFVHNESLDFFAALGGVTSSNIQNYFSQLLIMEVATSRQLEKIAFGNLRPHFFRMELQTDIPGVGLTVRPGTSKN